MDNLFFKDKNYHVSPTGKRTQFAFVCGHCHFKQIELLARQIPAVGTQKAEKSELPRKSTYSGLIYR